MSKYHRLRGAMGDPDPDTDEAIAAWLRENLSLGGYGDEIQLLRDGARIGEAEATAAVADAVSATPEYRHALRRMIADDPRWRDWAPVAEGVPPDGVAFEHGEFSRPVDLGTLEVVVGRKAIKRRLDRRTKKEESRETREEDLRRKLEETRSTAESDYLAHANCCGYLAANTAVRFNSVAKDQFGTSVMTRISGISLPELRRFIDSAGRATLADIDTHLDRQDQQDHRQPREYADDFKSGVMAMHTGFARDLVDFLDMESEVDVDAIARKHKEDKSDSGFQSLGHWGAPPEAVLARLVERRRDMDPGDIEEWFELGRAGELLLTGPGSQRAAGRE